ncbi:hypothetical protein EES43_27560 [Streptomyces sp. ADI96-02]|nr:hypothetical protein EES43_27560 [Streptomyces sp. ADI96-02]
MAKAREHGALTAVITGSPQSPIAAEVDVALHTGTGVGGSWTDYFAGRSSDSLIGALLWALVAQRIPDRIYGRAGHGDEAEHAPRNRAVFAYPSH